MKTILAVDDDLVVQRVMKATIKQCGYKPIIGVNGNDGFEKYEEAKDDIFLVLSDVLMPECDGVTFVQRLRDAGYNVPVVIVSTTPGRPDVVEKLKLIEWKVKPFDRAYLESIISQCQP